MRHNTNGTKSSLLKINPMTALAVAAASFVGVAGASCASASNLTTKADSFLAHRVSHSSTTGVAQAGSGLGAFSTSTKHMRQLAATGSLS